MTLYKKETGRSIYEERASKRERERERKRERERERERERCSRKKRNIWSGVDWIEGREGSR